MDKDCFPSMLDLIREVPSNVWIMIKVILFCILIFGGVFLVCLCAAVVTSCLWGAVQQYQSQQARTISKMVDREGETEKEEELEMLGKRENEEKGKMGGETVPGGEETGKMGNGS